MPSLTASHCRICFILCDKSAINAATIVDTYYEVTGYEIFPSDIPQKICKKCFVQLMISKKFRSICESSERCLEAQRQEKEKTTQEIPSQEANVSYNKINEEQEEVLPIMEINGELNFTVGKEIIEDSIEISESRSKIENKKVVAPSKKLITFQEYEKLETKPKIVRKKYKDEYRDSKIIYTKEIPKTNTNFVDWDYHLLRNFIEEKKIKVSESLQFVLSNQTIFKQLPKNVDTEIYKTSGNNHGLSCTFCNFTLQNSKHDEMQQHCIKYHRCVFKCFCSCSTIFPSLEVLRQHNKALHYKRIVFLRPLQCNFCRFSCSYEVNMNKHWNKMHSDKPLSVCENCQKEFSCDDLKMQHIVFQCRKGIDSFLAVALLSPFRRILKYYNHEDDLEEGEIRWSPKMEMESTF